MKTCQWLGMSWQNPCNNFWKQRLLHRDAGLSKHHRQFSQYHTMWNVIRFRNRAIDLMDHWIVWAEFANAGNLRRILAILSVVVLVNSGCCGA